MSPMVRQERQLEELLEPVRDRSDLVEGIVDVGGLADTLRLTGARSLDSASESDIVFCRPELEGVELALSETRAPAAVVTPETAEALGAEVREKRVLVLSSRPRLLLAYLLQAWAAEDTLWPSAGLDPRAVIAQSASIAPGVVVGPDVTIGGGCHIGPNSVINHTVIGENTTIGANCSIGVPGFSYETDEVVEKHIYFPHLGRVHIGDHVDIYSNCAIARGSLQDTVIGNEVKIDNLVHIAHNVVVQDGAFIIANTMLGGSVVVGKGAWLAPSTSVINGGHIGDYAMTGMGAVVTKDVAENTVSAGVPARRLRDRFGAEDRMLTVFRSGNAEEE